MIYFCGKNETTELAIEKENTKRNKWTYKRGPIQGSGNKRNKKMKQSTNRSYRAQMRTYLTHYNYDHCPFRDNKDITGFYKSPYQPSHKLDVIWVPNKYQLYIAERGVINSYKHKMARFPIDEILQRGEQSSSRHYWKNPDLQSTIKKKEYQRNIQEETLPFISIIFESSPFYREEGNNDKQDNLLSIISLEHLFQSN